MDTLVVLGHHQLMVGNLARKSAVSLLMDQLMVGNLARKSAVSLLMVGKLARGLLMGTRFYSRRWGHQIEVQSLCVTPVL